MGVVTLFGPGRLALAKGAVRIGEVGDEVSRVAHGAEYIERKGRDLVEEGVKVLVLEKVEPRGVDERKKSGADADCGVRGVG